MDSIAGLRGGLEAGIPVHRIGRYQIVKEIGRGAMGVVYLAMDPRIGRKVALKTIQIPAGLSPSDVAHYRERFRREGMAAGKLNHPHIVTVYDVGDDSETRASFIVMEYVEGVTLRQRIETGPWMTESEIRKIGVQLAEALDFAHQQKVIHRDVKPANVILTPAGDAKIMDFGIARLVDSDLTRDEQAIGSPAFMSPEQIRGGKVGNASDLFSLGVLLYQLATRRKPFEGPDTAAVMYRILNEEPIPPSQVPPPRGKRRGRKGSASQLSNGFDQIVTRLLRKNPAERYSRGKDLALDLTRPPRKGSPRRKAAAPPAAPRVSRFSLGERFFTIGGGLLLASILLLWGFRSGQASPADPPAAGAGQEESAGAASANEPAPFWKGWFEESVTDGAPTVEVRFSHHLSSGSLTVWMDGKKILSRELETETKGRTLFGRLQLKKPSGRISEVFTVEPGLHRVEALVESPQENVSVRGETELDLSDGQAGRLVIDMNRWFGKRLALKWR